MKPDSPYCSPHKSKGGLRRLFSAARYSMQGLAAAVRHESAFRQELAGAALLLPAAFWVGRSVAEIALLVLSVWLVLVVELLNSAVEALADAVSLENHPLLGRAKDLGSAAVLLTVLFAAGIWIAVLAHRYGPW